MKKCGRCSKPAVLHITEVRNGEAQALHLCESCAKQYLSQNESGPDEEGPGFLPGGEEGESEDADSQVCPNCGISFKEFRAGGRLGCPHDYTVFEEQLLPLLENIHGETEHCGKIPKRAPDSSRKQFQLIRLRNELKAAVDEERYEEAARIRDEIQSIETESAPAE